jgi:dTDP-4-dehydrorhamnose 3,5-epimerase
MQSLGIEGAFVSVPRIFPDHRGSFHTWFRAADLLDDLGYHFELAQANCSVSHQGVLRGVHFSEVPPGQAKYVTCASGAILDVVVDLRVGSPTYLRWAAVPLNDEARQAVFISEGLGHAFVALSPQATVMYFCSTPYAPAIEHGVDPFDPEIGIAWPQDLKFILSDKDASAPSAEAARQAGLLPGYAECLAYAGSQG